MRRIRGLKSRPDWAASDVVQDVVDDIVNKLGTLRRDEFGHVSGRHLYSVRKQIGAKISELSRAGKSADKRLASGLQREIQKYIDDAIEDAGGVGWKDYLQKYQEMSKPIDRMRVGQELEKALTKPLDEAERPASFAAAVREAPRTLKKSTGQSRYDSLEEVLTPDEVKAVSSVLDDIKRSSENVRLGRIGTERASEIVGATAPALPQAGMFNPKYSVLRAISNRLSGRVAGKAIDRLSELMEADPKKLAQLMEGLPPEEQVNLMYLMTALQRSSAAVPYTQ